MFRGRSHVHALLLPCCVVTAMFYPELLSFIPPAPRLYRKLHPERVCVGKVTQGPILSAVPHAHGGLAHVPMDWGDDGIFRLLSLSCFHSS